MIVDILGTKYVVKQDDSIKDTGADGLCKTYGKEILYRDAKDMLCSDYPQELKEERWREVIRHELIHAFFHEAGLEEYSNDEVLVNWIAYQFPKIQLAIEQTGAGGE